MLLQFLARRLVRASALAVGTLALPTVLTAQTLAPPGPPDAPAEGIFSSITGEWTFSGCAAGQVQSFPQPIIIGTPFCLAARVTLGRGVFGSPWPGEPGYAALSARANFVMDPRVDRVGPGLVQFFGTRTDASCSVGCPWNALTDDGRSEFIGGGVEIAHFTAFVLGPDPAAFSPTSINIGVEYHLAGNRTDEANRGGSVQAQLTAVPEPATVSLLGPGLATLLIAARRRRSRRSAP